ncbi:Trk system potassium transporter TrkA [bacterium]|nr:Trk system potassium transporter TrkA [bacterium]
MDIIIAGAGEVGYYLARYLAEENHNVTVIDGDESQIGRIENHLDVNTVVGNAASAVVLERAEVHNAELFLATTNRDETNMLAALIAKKLKAKRTVARIRKQEDLVGRQRFYRNLLGIDLVVNPDRLTAHEVKKLVRETGSVGVEDYAYGQVHLRRIVVKPKSKITKRPLKDIKLPSGILIAAVIRGDEIIIPYGDTTIEGGDHIIIITTRETVSVIKRLVGGIDMITRRVMIAGDTNIAEEVARDLSSMPIEIKLISGDRRRAFELAETYSNVQIIEGDCRDLSFLKEEHIELIDIFVAATDVDEVSVMSAMLAKESGAKETAVVLNKGEYVQISHRLNIDVVLSPRLLAVNKILQFIRRGNINSISLIGEGAAEVIEFTALAGSRGVGRPLASINLPRGAIVGAVVKESEVIIPGGDDVIEVGDSVILFALAENLKTVERMFDTNAPTGSRMLKIGAEEG